MELLAAVALALVLGLIVGLVLGARRRVNLILAGQTIRPASLARLMPDDMPARAPGDVLAGRVRVELGTVAYDLPVLARGPSRRWLEQVDAEFAMLAEHLDESVSVPGVLAILVQQTDSLYRLLQSYDQSHVLPAQGEIEETATDSQILRAVLEVWRAAHPLADDLLSLEALTRGMPLASRSSSPASTAGAPSSSSLS